MRTILFLLLLLACSPSADLPEKTVPPITGAQLDRIELSFRDAGMKRAMWASVERADDETRLVVHARMSEIPPAWCDDVKPIIGRGLLPGQAFEIYMILESRVVPCR